ncbi:MAG: DUF4340 domain-containing protein [Chryseolinea sp.]
MQEKKNKRLLILLLLLIGATGTAFWLTAREDRTQTDKHLFKNFDLKTISQITLQKEGDTVNLVYTGARWMVNEKFPADPAMIEVLFATLQQAEPKRPLAATQTDSIGGLLRQKAVKVTLISNGSAVSSFFAGGNNAKNQAYFMQEGESTPYLMNIPGYRVYVSGIFELDESGWREKRVFAFNWRNFRQLDATFPGSKADDFTVSMENQYFTIPGLHVVDTTRLNNFLDDVSLLTADEFVPNTRHLDSLSKTIPILTVLVKDIAGREYTWSIFPPAGEEAPFPALITGGQWAYFHPNKVEGLVRPRGFFGK